MAVPAIHQLDFFQPAIGYSAVEIFGGRLVIILSRDDLNHDNP